MSGGTDKQSGRFYLTTPIYYVNDVPHIGHAYTTIAADTMCRYMRLRGRDVFFLTGTDEHGQKVQQAARARGVEPQQHCDELHQRFKDLWTRLRISNDRFIRTTDAEHKRLVQEGMQRIFDKGEIYSKPYEGWYSITDEQFVPEMDVSQEMIDSGKVERVSEINYFFRMSAYQQRLIKHIEDNPDFIRPEIRRNEILGFLRKPLEDLSISRPKTRLAWGIELPFDHDHVIYVWFDALMNYVTANHYLMDGPGWDGGFDPYWPADFHLIGKDILTTHCVYWPTMLMAMDLPLPRSVYAHGWWTIEGQKMSKSLRNVVDPHRLIDTFGADPIRYFLLREMPFGNDGDFSMSSLLTRINSDLANDLGNLAKRVLDMVAKYCGSIPEIKPPKSEGALKIHERIKEAAEKSAAEMEQLHFNKALQEIWALIGECNGYIQASEPWKIAGKAIGGEEDWAKKRLNEILLTGLYTLKAACRLVYPIMPTAMASLWERLGETEPLENAAWSSPDDLLAPPRAGYEVPKQEALFPRIDPASLDAESFVAQAAKEEAGGKEPTAALAEEPITIDDFGKVELRVATVVEAEKVKKSKKLLKLQVAIGETEDGRPIRRQVVAGIALSYEPEEIIGKQVVVVFNLQPAKLMGTESQGMVLATDAEDGERLALLTPEIKAKEGAGVR